MKKKKSVSNKNTLKKDRSFVSSDKYTFTNMQREKSKEEKKKDKSYISTGSYIHDFLYDEAKINKAKKENLEKQWMDVLCPFKPKVSNASRALVRRDETMDDFLKRLMTSKKETEELIVEVRQKQIRKNKTDQSRTKTKRAKTDRSLNLESYYDKKLLDDKNKIQSEEIVNNLEKKKHWLENSMKIVLKMKIDKYKEIFDSLDHDKDGFISSKSIKLSTIQTDLLETLTPLLEEIQSKNLTLNFKDFCIIGDRILSMKIFTAVRA